MENQNQTLQEQLETLKELLDTEKAELAMREKWVKEAKVKILAMENRIENIDKTLKEEASS